jgi:hypothetical protein
LQEIPGSSFGPETSYFVIFLNDSDEIPEDYAYFKLGHDLFLSEPE